ncbi:MAG: 50S ribosomal protein L29 [Phycisphaera sp.]|nr:50S ribosomal protein L29 [Phycisphaera sp.]
MKAQEAHKMSDEELAVEIDRLRRHLYDLKSQAVTEKLEDPSQVRKTRRDIARLLTETNSRQMKTTETTQS